MNRFITACVLGLLVLTGQGERARAGMILAGWDFSGLSNSGPSPFAPTTSNPQVSVGGLTRGDGIGAGTAGNVWGGTGWNTSSVAAAIVAEDFLTFSLTPNVGATLSLSSIPLYRTIRSGTGPNIGQWQYQLGSGEFQNIGGEVDWGSSSSGNTANRASIDLTPFSELGNIFDQTVTLRLVNWGTTSSTGTWYFADNVLQTNTEAPHDLVIRGSVTSVPEPTSLLLAGIAGAVGWAGHRWKKKRSRCAAVEG